MVITITQVRLHQVAAARHLPPAAPRRRRRDRDGHEGRRLHRAPLRVLDARLPAVLHQPRQGLPLEGLRAAGGVAHGQGPLPRSTCCRCARASGCSPCSRRATSPRRKYLVFATRKGMVKKTEFLAYNTPIKADGIIAINIRDDDELVAVRRVDAGDEILMVSRAGLAVALHEERRARDGPRHQRRARHGRRRQGQRRARDGRRARTTRTCSSSPRTATASARAIDEYRKTRRGAKGVKTITLTEAQGRARRRARRARAPGARLHLARTAWSSARACAASTATAARRRASS